MNIGALVVEASDFPVLHKNSAIGYRDLMGMKIKHHRRKRNRSLWRCWRSGMEWENWRETKD